MWVIVASKSAGSISWPWEAPAALEIVSFIRVPPKSLHPAASNLAPPSRPSFTQEAWMLGIRPSRARRATA